MAGNELFDNLYRKLSKCTKVPGVTQLDILNLPPPLDRTLSKITRKGSITVGEFADDLQLAPGQGEYLGQLLIKKGYLYAVKDDEDEQIIYKIRFARKQKRRVSTNVWDSLDF